MIALLDPGHGGPYPGAVANGTRECDVNLSVSRLLAQVLRSRGAQAFLTRDGDYALYEYDRFVDIDRRVAMVQKTKANLLLSIHCNAAANPQAHGMEVWTTVGQNNSDKMAQQLIDALQDALPLRRFRIDTRDGDEDLEKDFNIIKQAPCPAALAELGFLTNDEERQFLIAPRNQVALANAMADGLGRWWRAR
jgi:N-acetylmuramoyl-L-alanine amidase